MRSLGSAVAVLPLTMSACVHDPSPVSARADRDAGSDISGAAATAPTESTSKMGSSAGAIDVHESAGRAECLTADGAPYVAPKC
jgi:hypothetical protein